MYDDLQNLMVPVFLRTVCRQLACPARGGYASVHVRTITRPTRRADRPLGFPPLILLIAPIALTFLYAGRGPGFVALAVAAVAGDYLFVDPAGQFTFHNEGIMLTAYLSAGALIMYFTAIRRDGRPRSG